MAYITNSAETDFGDISAGTDITISHYSIILNYGETGEQLLITKDLAASRTYVAGDPLILPAGALDGNFINGDYEDAAVKSIIDAYLATKTHGATVLLGTGTMGNTGKGNEVPTARGYSRQVVALSTGLGTAPTS